MKIYTRTLFANVLLRDGKIINWKTGKTSWENGNWINSRQPINFISSDYDLRSETFKKVVNSVFENNLFFENAKEFYKMYEIHELFPDSMLKPY